MASRSVWIFVAGAGLLGAVLTVGSGERLRSFEESQPRPDPGSRSILPTGPTQGGAASTDPWPAEQNRWGDAAGAAVTGSVGQEPSLAYLRAALQARDLASAKRLLATDLRDTGAVDDLAHLVYEARDLVVQLMTVQALASIEGEAASGALARIARDSTVPLRVRTQALIGLSSQPAELARPALQDFLMADTPELRLAALRALGLLADPEDLPVLENAIQHEQDVRLRRAGFEAIARLQTPGAAALLLDFAEPEAGGETPERAAALWAIGTISSPHAVPELLEAWANTNDPALRLAAIRALASSADARSFDALIDTVERSQDSEARLQAINGLGLLGDPRALPSLRFLEREADDRERRYARTAIERIERVE